MRSLSSLLSTVLAVLLAASPAGAQIPTSAGASPDSLQIRALTAGGSRLAVQVVDGAGAPVSNAAVVFHLSEEASSGKFLDGTSAYVAYTDATGKAISSDLVAAGINPEIRVTAAKGTAHAGLLYERGVFPAASLAEPQPVTAQPQPMPAAQAQPLTVIAQPLTVSAQPQTAERMPVKLVQHPVLTEPRAVEHHVSAPAIVIENFAARPESARPGRLANQEAPAVSHAPVPDDDLDSNVPVRRSFAGAAAADVPSVSIVSSGAASSGGGHSKAKWIAIIALAAGAGAALAFVHPRASGGTAASGISIGAPTVNVGHP